MALGLQPVRKVRCDQHAGIMAADSCNALANTGILGKHFAAAIYDAPEEISKPTPY